MTKDFHPANERIKRAYFGFLREAKGFSEPSIDAAAKAISRFESYTRHKDFKLFHVDQATAFKRHLSGSKANRSGEPLSKATVRQTLSALKAFFQWLSGQPGYKSRIAYMDANYFNPTLKDIAIAKAPREQRFPTVEQVHHVLSVMPHSTDVERRNRAMIAYALLTCARADSIASVRLKHIDLVRGVAHQDAREVRTKFSKTFPVFFFPVGGEALEIFTDWVNYLRKERLCSPEDPVFPATRVAHGDGLQFKAIGLTNKCWTNSGPVRTIFKEAFEAAGLPYFNPHSLRKTLALLGESVCQTPEEFKSWSQNMAHEDVMTTFRSYGVVPVERQRELIQNAGKAKLPDLGTLVADIEFLKRAYAKGSAD